MNPEVARGHRVRRWTTEATPQPSLAPRTVSNVTPVSAVDHSDYRFQVGRFVSVGVLKPNLLYGVSQFSKSVHSSMFLKMLVRNLKATIDRETGIIFLAGACVVLWSRIQDAGALSPCAAELYASVQPQKAHGWLLSSLSSKHCGCLTHVHHAWFALQDSTDFTKLLFSRDTSNALTPTLSRKRNRRSPSACQARSVAVIHFADTSDQCHGECGICCRVTYVLVPLLLCAGRMVARVYDFCELT